MLRPLPGGAIVLIAIVACDLSGALDLAASLAGYGNPMVWLVLAAFLIARALIKTGLARRIALGFVSAFGKNSTGVASALILSDVTLATIIPSNTARAGGVILPITKSIAELYGSRPGSTAALLGTFLMVAVYQGECIASAMFLTGQAGNFAAADLSRTLANVEVTWARWALVAIVPAAVSMAGVIWLVARLLPPEIKHTPKAREFARDEIAKMGRFGRDQWVVLLIFTVVCSLWLTADLHGLSITLVALIGVAALFLSGVLTWREAIEERAAWDIFIWYGGVVRLGGALNEAGVTEHFARSVGEYFSGFGWAPLLAVTLVIYFYAHYGFASITMHIVSMFPPFLALLLLRGAPPELAVYGFACLSNLAAGLTHYGTVPGPMFFALDYVSFRDWWRVGFLVAIWNLAVWGILGAIWGKVVGIW
jgi:DASS family divalent anion:Na+ symporter